MDEQAKGRDLQIGVRSDCCELDVFGIPAPLART